MQHLLSTLSSEDLPAEKKLKLKQSFSPETCSSPERLDYFGAGHQAATHIIVLERDPVSWGASGIVITPG